MNEESLFEILYGSSWICKVLLAFTLLLSVFFFSIATPALYIPECIIPLAEVAHGELYWEVFYDAIVVFGMGTSNAANMVAMQQLQQQQSGFGNMNANAQGLQPGMIGHPTAPQNPNFQQQRQQNQL